MVSLVRLKRFASINIRSGYASEIIVSADLILKQNAEIKRNKKTNKERQHETAQRAITNNEYLRYMHMGSSCFSTIFMKGNNPLWSFGRSECNRDNLF